jgi:hypothetical protein
MVNLHAAMAMTFGAILAAMLWNAPAVAGACVHMGSDGKCEDQTYDPQPNSGDPAPGYMDQSSEGGAGSLGSANPADAAPAVEPPPPPPPDVSGSPGTKDPASGDVH